MIVKQSNKYPLPTPINDINDKKLKEKLINIFNHIDEIENKKIKDFEGLVKKIRNDKNYKLTNFLLKIHFLFKAVHELNEEFLKNEEIFLVDFTDKAYEKFFDQTLLYFEEYYDYENETFNMDAIDMDTCHLDLLIKKHKNDKKFIPKFKKISTNLPKLYAGV